LAVLEAIARPTIDHRGPEFARLAKSILSDIRWVFGTSHPVVIYPASGTGAWEAAVVNTLSPGDKILMYETGWFANLWCRIMARLGVEAESIPGNWRSGVDADAIEARLVEDKAHAIKAVAIVHNETSTGVASNVPRVRQAIDGANHPALLMVDTVSSLGSIDYRHDEWGVDVAVGCSQKGLMLPPGLSFNAISDKALAASTTARLPRSYWDWRDMLATNEHGSFPYTPATNLLQGLRISIDLLTSEGLPAVFSRHDRAAEATRRSVRHWGLELNCQSADEYSSSLTAIRVPRGHSADEVRAEILARCNMSLGNGLGVLADKVFRIGHLGDFNDLTVVGTLAGIEIGMQAAGVPFRAGGVDAAIAFLAGNGAPAG
jgi:alanine-glyoxylate transaminase/serine-glyoxylate transaminase/serine-pyruvate transaminase